MILILGLLIGYLIGRYVKNKKLTNRIDILECQLRIQMEADSSYYSKYMETKNRLGEIEAENNTYKLLIKEGY